MLIRYDVMYMLWSQSTPILKKCKFIYCTSLFVNIFSYMKVYFYVQPQDFLFVVRTYSYTKDILGCKY